jgi:NAD(P)-dependent dehydrogenase (short-subunit alcohol dehydrogenase family)
MTRLNDAMVVVAGGTGNVGSHVVRALLADGARVVVPSRSPEKLQDLVQYIASRVPAAALENLIALVGDVGEEADAQRVADQIVAELGVPTAVFASLGRFTPAPRLLESHAHTLQQVLRDYVTAHFATARAFLPHMRNAKSKYVFVNGPLAFEPWEHTASGLVSIATAGQHMLFRALAQELKAESPQLIELVIYSFLRNRETQPGATVSGEDTGAFTADLVAGAVRASHGESIHLRTSVLHRAS